MGLASPGLFDLARKQYSEEETLRLWREEVNILKSGCVDLSYVLRAGDTRGASNVKGPKGCIQIILAVQSLTNRGPPTYRVTAADPHRTKSIGFSSLRILCCFVHCASCSVLRKGWGEHINPLIGSAHRDPEPYAHRPLEKQRIPKNARNAISPESCMPHSCRGNR